MQPSAAMAQPPALAPGVVLRNRYLIEGYIGGGGFGHIYRARDIALGHLRAIKEAFSRDPNTQRQFQLEAEFLLNARHPNLVRGYSVFESAGRLYLVMDYVDGHTLEDIAIEMIKRTHRPPVETQALDWMAPICNAVHELHAQPAPIIHRDIKPANIKLSASLNIPILIDLGLAKLFAQGQQTIAAALAFTPGYAPPEQYQAAGTTDQRTDVYGLGATLYYLLTGYQPVDAPARLSAQALPTPRDRNPHLSDGINEIVL
ncbi:MAG TPA: serine/threonine-protein kinase, partial [Ktedonobacterales bacterium]